MKAVLHTKYGPPGLLKVAEVAKPEPKANELLIKVHAATVNRTDCAILRAKPFIMRFLTGFLKPSKPTPGTDFAGEVVAIGKTVKSFAIGDRLMGFNDSGLSSHAEFMVIAADQDICKIPANSSYSAAAASIEGAFYAHNCSNKVTLRAGQTVMLNGATGAIGSALLQLLKNEGLHVTATCKTAQIERIKALGAAHVIDYTKDDFTKQNQRFDFVMDTVGKSSFGKCKPILKPKGIYISSELGWMAQNLFYAATTPLMGGKKVIFPIPSDPLASIKLINRLTTDGKFEPLIDRSYSIEQISEAFEYVESGEKIGNVILQLSGKN